MAEHSTHIETKRSVIDGMNAMHEWSPKLLGQNLYRLTKMKKEQANFDCRTLVNSYRTFYHHERWRDFAPSWDEFREHWFECPQEWLDYLARGLDILDGQGHQGPVPAEQALEKALEAKAQEVKPQATNSEAKQGNKNALKGKEENDADNISVVFAKPKYGNSQEYLLGRIKRDFPELIPRIGETKEFTSARAAAIHCGIVKHRKHIYLSTPEKMAQKLAETLSPEDLLEMTQELAQTLSREDLLKLSQDLSDILAR